MRHARPVVPALALLALLAVLAGSAAAPLRAAPGGDDLKKQMGDAAQQGNWAQVAELMGQLARGGNADTWKFLARVAERAPATSDCAAALRAAAQVMTDRRVQEEVKKTALKSTVVAVRRQLVLHLAAQQDWPSLIALLGDADEETASIAAWRLVDGHVEAAIEPMITHMDRLDRSHAGIWDVLRNGLGTLLGGRSESAVEYRSRWTVIKGAGGLASVHTDPAAAPVETGGGGGEMRSSVRLFGRAIDCTRVVFVLDVSGSMVAVDPGQTASADPSSRTRDPGPTTPGAPQPPPGKTRLQRAQEELKRVLQALPESTKVNIVAYSSRVQLWRSSESDAPPQLVAMTSANKQSACEFVDQFRADGVTVTDDALRRAFDVEGARCFYLLSDGTATHDGTTPVPTPDILRVVDELGKDRHVTIHTLGFVGADREMMTTLAQHTGGMYSDIK